MEARLKEKLPQEGTGDAGESVPELSSGCPAYSGGGKVVLSVEKPTKTLTQQLFHPGLFNRQRSASLGDARELIKKHNDKQQEKLNEQENNVTDLHNPNIPWQRMPNQKRNRSPEENSLSKSNEAKRLHTRNQLISQNRDITESTSRQSPEITMLFNAILRVHYYPKLWQIAQVCMVIKPGKPASDPSSYRPISLLPVLSKVFETVFLKRLKPLLDQEKIIPDHQFGFRAKHSTVEQVHRVVHKIRQSLEKKEYCSAAFIDIKQAFDKVWHKGLLYKLKTLLPNSFFMLLRSYLKHRKFQVKFGEDCSKLYNINASVPQGSVLGPVLFSIYTADLPQSQDVVTATYADDTACLASDIDPHNASLQLQVQLDKVDAWLQRWRLKPSVTKSTQVTFTLRKGICGPVYMEGKALPNADSVKYLGLHLDRRLTWANHIKAKKREANLQFLSLNWLLGRRSPLSLSNKLLVYKAIIKPVWTYGIELWGSASNSNIEILQRFQNIALRTISNAHWFVRNSEIHEYLEMPTVREEVNKNSKRYKERLNEHSNELARCLLDTTGDVKRLKRWQILDLDQRY